MIINENNIDEKIPSHIKVERFDMAINFYEFFNKKGKLLLKTYDYNPVWNSWYPFYDDQNKEPIFYDSKAKTYTELINEYESFYKINLEEKILLAKQRYFEITGEECQRIKPAKTFILWELKYSQTAKVYTLYKLFNYIVDGANGQITIKNICKSMKCKVFDINSGSFDGLVENAQYFINKEIKN